MMCKLVMHRLVMHRLLMHRLVVHRIVMHKFVMHRLVGDMLSCGNDLFRSGGSWFNYFFTFDDRLFNF